MLKIRHKISSKNYIIAACIIGCAAILGIATLYTQDFIYNQSIEKVTNTPQDNKPLPSSLSPQTEAHNVSSSQLPSQTSQPPQEPRGKTPQTNDQSTSFKSQSDLTPDIPPLPKSTIAPVISKINTKKRVVFMGVDDGAIKDPRAIEYIKKHHYPFTLFLSHIPAGANYSYFKPLLTDADNTVQDHTIHHPNLYLLGYQAQKDEICGQAENIRKNFGTPPTLFRPPFGNYNNITQHVVAECGMKAIVLWSAKVNDGKIQYQTGNHIVPGDIMLMHFRPKIMEDLQAFTNEIESQHLTVAKLEDWLR